MRWVRERWRDIIEVAGCVCLIVAGLLIALPLGVLVAGAVLIWLANFSDFSGSDEGEEEDASTT